MTYKVVKFGGSNLKDKDGIKNVLNAIYNYNQSLIIVVSAFYGVTDQLVNAIDLSVKGELDLDHFLTEIFNLKEKTILENVSDTKVVEEFKNELEIRLKKLKAFLLGVKYINDVPPFLYDEILSYGEKLSSLVLYTILKSKNVNCKEVFPEKIGLFTDGEFKNGTVDFNLSASSLKQNLSENLTYIIPGFYGVSKKGKITLLGRGGSDYSAAAIANCLDADSLDLWKDVEGFLSADPRIVPDSVNVKSLTYAEAAELAYFGSKILHPRTSEPLAKKKIPIRIFNINNTIDGISPLTVINGKETVTDNVVKSVSYSDHFGILKLHGSGVGVKPGILAKSTALLDKTGVNIKSVITSQTTINILLSEEDLFTAKNVIQQEDIHGVSEIEIYEKISLIAAVGEGLTSQYGVAGRIFSTVARKGINIEIICFGASSVAMYFIVNHNDRNETVQEIHKEFFTSEVLCNACI